MVPKCANPHKGAGNNKGKFSVRGFVQDGPLFQSGSRGDLVSPGALVAALKPPHHTGEPYVILECQAPLCDSEENREHGWQLCMCPERAEARTTFDTNDVSAQGRRLFRTEALP
jgi:hypothetical protein